MEDTDSRQKTSAPAAEVASHAPPQTSQSATPSKKKTSVDAGQIATVLKNWKIPKSDIADLLGATQRSLETVTHLTEYEDDKANRILTAMAFLSAFAAVIFAVVPSRYPLSIPLILMRAGLRWQAYLLFATYGGFVLYAFTLIAGVAFVLVGMRPRFNIPESWKPEGSRPPSYLFSLKIIEVSPTDWADSFLTTDKDELLSTYVKNSVLETYLVAEKITTKLKWIQRGVAWFQFSSIVLAIVLPIVVATLTLVPEPPERRQPVEQQVASPNKEGAQPANGQELRIDPPAPATKSPRLKPNELQTPARNGRR